MTDTVDRSHKLDHFQQQSIKYWLAEDWEPSVVAKFVKEAFDIEISRQTVFHYSKRYATEIQTLRENSRITDIPISQKEVRQRRREAIFQRYINQDKLEEARQVLRDAQDEMEPRMRGIHVSASATAGAEANNGNIAAARKRVSRNLRIFQGLGLSAEPGSAD